MFKRYMQKCTVCSFLRSCDSISYLILLSKKIVMLKCEEEFPFTVIDSESYRIFLCFSFVSWIWTQYCFTSSSFWWFCSSCLQNYKLDFKSDMDDDTPNMWTNSALKVVLFLMQFVHWYCANTHPVWDRSSMFRWLMLCFTRKQFPYSVQ